MTDVKDIPEDVHRGVEAAWQELFRQREADEGPYVNRSIDLIDGCVDMPALVKAIAEAIRAPSS